MRHYTLHLHHKLVLLLGGISKIHFVRRSSRVAALNKPCCLRGRNESKPTQEHISKVSYSVYHIELNVNPGKNTFQWPELRTHFPPWLSTPMQWLGDFTLTHDPEFPKAPRIPNHNIQQPFEKTRTYWRSTICLWKSEPDFVRSWLRVWIMKTVLVNNIRKNLQLSSLANHMWRLKIQGHRTKKKAPFPYYWVVFSMGFYWWKK